VDYIKLNRFKFGETGKLVNLVTTLTERSDILNMYSVSDNSDLTIRLESEPVYIILNTPHKDLTIPIYECKLSRNTNSDPYKYPFAMISKDINCENRENDENKPNKLVRLAGHIYKEKYYIHTLELFRCNRLSNNDHWISDSGLLSKECVPGERAKSEFKIGNALQIQFL